MRQLWSIFTSGLEMARIGRRDAWDGADEPYAVAEAEVGDEILSLGVRDAGYQHRNAGGEPHCTVLPAEPSF